MDYRHQFFKTEKIGRLRLYCDLSYAIFRRMPTIAQPCSGHIAKKHEKKTLDKAVDLFRRDVWETLTEEQRRRVAELYPSGKAYLWGNRRGKKDYNIKNARVDMIHRGMDVVFVAKSEIYRRGTVGYAFHNPELARILWGQEDEQTWEFIFTIDNLHRTRELYGSKLMRVTLKS